MTAVCAVAGGAVMVENIARHPRVVHRLATVRPATMLYPYVMVCGYATSSVLPAAEGLERCVRCWA
jgi:hypothetical protein